MHDIIHCLQAYVLHIPVPTIFGKNVLSVTVQALPCNFSFEKSLSSFDRIVHAIIYRSRLQELELRCPGKLQFSCTQNDVKSVYQATLSFWACASARFQPKPRTKSLLTGITITLARVLDGNHDDGSTHKDSKSKNTAADGVLAETKTIFIILVCLNSMSN